MSTAKIEGWVKRARKAYPRSQVDVPSGFACDKKNKVVYITGFDVDVVLVVRDRDLDKLESMVRAAKAGLPATPKSFLNACSEP